MARRRRIFDMCHSRASGNPAASVHEPHESYAPLTRRNWIPAFAGMTFWLKGK